MPKIMMLHIGIPKTGSSFLQSTLAGNIEVLKRHGIDYPVPRRVEKAAAGQVSTGNATQLEQFLKQPEAMRDIAAERVLFSGERFFMDLCKQRFQDDLLALIGAAGIERVEILMFVRDPVSFAISSYQQQVKRGKIADLTIEGHFARMNQPVNVNKVLDFGLAQPKVALTVRNYSVVRPRLLDEFCLWLGLPRDELTTPPAQVVNRSMTTSELMLLKAMNDHVKASSTVIAEALCNRLPDIRGDDHRPPVALQERLWQRLAPEIARINARIDPAQAYDRQRDIVAPRPAPEGAEFSTRQVEVMAEAMAGLVARARDVEPKLAALTDRVRVLKERNAALLAKLGLAKPDPEEEGAAGTAGEPDGDASRAALRQRRAARRLALS